MGMLDVLWNDIARLNAAVYLENLWRRRRGSSFIYSLFKEPVPSLLHYVSVFDKEGKKWPTEVLGEIPDNDEAIWKLIDEYPVLRCK